MATKERIDPNKIKTRDEAVKTLICGATKTGPHKNKKKERNKRACRGPTPVPSPSRHQ